MQSDFGWRVADRESVIDQMSGSSSGDCGPLVAEMIRSINRIALMRAIEACDLSDREEDLLYSRETARYIAAKIGRML